MKESEWWEIKINISDNERNNKILVIIKEIKINVMGVIELDSYLYRLWEK